MQDNVFSVHGIRINRGQIMKNEPHWYGLAEKFRREGRTLQYISDLLGVAVPTLRTQLVLRMNDYDTFKQPTSSNEARARSARIIEAVEQKESITKIAKREEVSRQWIYKLLKRKEEKLNRLVKNEVDKKQLEKKFKGYFE